MSVENSQPRIFEALDLMDMAAHETSQRPLSPDAASQYLSGAAYLATEHGYRLDVVVEPTDTAAQQIEPDNG